MFFDFLNWFLNFLAFFRKFSPSSSGGFCFLAIVSSFSKDSLSKDSLEAADVDFSFALNKDPLEVADVDFFLPK